MRTLDQWILAAIGAAFGLRVFDSRKPLPIRIGYGIVGWDLLRGIWANGTEEAIIEQREPVSIGRVAANDLQLPADLPKLTFEHRKVSNIQERVDLIHRQMLHGVKDPTIYTLARKTLVDKNVPAKDARAEIQAMFDLVKERTRYTWDPLQYDAFQTPRKTLELQTADCDDMVSLLGALLSSIGYRVRSRVVHTKGFDSWNHIYLMAQNPETSEWIPLDTTVEHNLGWQVPDSHLVKPRKDFDLVER